MSIRGPPERAVSMSVRSDLPERRTTVFAPRQSSLAVTLPVLEIRAAPQSE